MSAELTMMLSLEEKYMQFVYLDSLGISTVAFGRNIDGKRNGKGLSKSESLILLGNDIIDATSDVPAWVLVLSPARRDALIALCFQLGKAGFFGFVKMLAAAKAGDWQTASAELLNSKMATQVPARVHRLSQQLLTNTYIYNT